LIRSLDPSAPESTDAALLFIDTTLRIRGANGAYARATHGDQAKLVGQLVFDAFPDNPDDPQARGTHDLGISFETAMRTGRTHNMPILRFDILDPANPGAFIPKVWSPRNSPVHDHGQLVGVLHHAEEITELHGALSAMARAAESDTALSPREQLHTLAAFTAALPRDIGVGCADSPCRRPGHDVVSCASSASRRSARPLRR
jgi:hypothetical protein